MNDEGPRLYIINFEAFLIMLKSAMRTVWDNFEQMKDRICVKYNTQGSMH